MLKPLFAGLFILSLTACGTVQKAQYSMLEKVGVHKRDILVDRIEQATQTQQETAEQFQTAYEKFSELVAVDDGGLEKKYKTLSSQLQDSEAKVDELKKRIASIEEVAEDLFEEWKQELDQYTSQSLRKNSEQRLLLTQQRYQVLLKKMQNAEQSVYPVLRILQDNTLFLKHNLNARAIDSLQSEVVSVQGKVDVLIEQMQASIAESQAFLRTMRGAK